MRSSFCARSWRSLIGIPLLLACGASGPESPAPWNLLLITVDTLRVDRLGAYGSPLGLTPQLDAFAAESELFERAYAPTSYTLPSLAALVTGRYPEEVGILDNYFVLVPDVPTLASALASRGWRTGAVVSNFVLRPESGIARGFDVYDHDLPQREVNRDMPERVARSTTDAALALLAALRAGAREPVFLWVHYQDPHGPYTPPQGYRKRYIAAERAAPGGDRRLPLSDGPRGFGAIPLYQYLSGQRRVAFYRAGYDGEVRYADEQVGRLLDEVRASGFLDETVAVFSADHGEGLGEDDYWFAHGEYLTNPMVHVPLWIRVPGRAPRRRADPVSLVDVAPTVAALLGLPALREARGRDLFASGAPEQRPAIYLNSLEASTVPRFALVAEGYKYMLSTDGAGQRESLFQLDDETNDLADSMPERLRAMRQQLAAIRDALPASPRREEQQLSPEDREMLRALGSGDPSAER